MKSEVENNTGKLFGRLWTRLTDEQYQESVELFTKRAVANNFDVRWLEGKRCLDAGCGSGRYSVAMALHGAESVVAVDISDSGLAEAARRTSEFTQISYRNASVLNLPFNDSEFDFVWSAGVIHHTTDFMGALRELTRVLRPGGKLFLLVYGSGGMRWKAIKALRPIAAEIGEDLLERSMVEYGLPANNTKHFMDDLFVPVQKLTSFHELNTCLYALGLTVIDRWVGETYDHEGSPSAQLDDMDKLVGIFTAGIRMASTPAQRYLLALGSGIAEMFVETARKVINDNTLMQDAVRDIVIGEGNLRVMVTKG